MTAATIKSADEAERLPHGSVLLDSAGAVYQVSESRLGKSLVEPGFDMDVPMSAPLYPARVLHEPTSEPTPAERFAEATDKHPGGIVEGPGLVMQLRIVGTCPLGHRQYQINGEQTVQHILTSVDLDALSCPYRLQTLEEYE